MKKYFIWGSLLATFSFTASAETQHLICDGIQNPYLKTQLIYDYIYKNSGFTLYFNKKENKIWAKGTFQDKEFFIEKWNNDTIQFKYDSNDRAKVLLNTKDKTLKTFRWVDLNPKGGDGHWGITDKLKALPIVGNFVEIETVYCLEK